jgi:hypothetical protein
MDKKYLKIIFPIVGVFLVIYLAFNAVNIVKMKGIVTQLNDKLEDEFIIIDSSIGNVFIDESFIVTAKSERTGYVYDFTYEEGIIDTAPYEIENRARQFTQSIQQNLSEEFVVFVNKVAVSNPQTVTFVSTESEKSNEQLLRTIKELENQQIAVRHYIGDASQIEQFRTEVLALYPYTEITTTMLSYYKLIEQ